MQWRFQVVMQGRQHGRGDHAEMLPGGHAGASTWKGGTIQEGFQMVMQERQQGRGDHAGMLPGGQIKV
jgi:hypothetical protein